ncbi:34379_t:CDS:2, partial [Gigaspora margarita]
GKRKIGSDMTEEDRKDFGLFRENIRKKFQIEIENIGGKWEDKDIENLSGCLELEELMIRKYKKNRLENRENLVFYMDGFLVRTSAKKGEIDKMVASWVQVGLDKEKILDTGYVSTQEWLLSTKLELLAI